MTQPLSSDDCLKNQDALDSALLTWLDLVFADTDFSVQSLAGDASSRRYHRLTVDAVSYIVMDSSADKAAMAQFVNVAELMSVKIHVPKIIAKDLEQGFLVLEDFGAVEFAHLLIDADDKAVDGYYQWAMAALIELQKIPVEMAKDKHQIPDYDAEMLNREMDLFSDWLLPYLGVTIAPALWQSFKSELIAAISAQPQVIVHRDYHSRNLMQSQNDNSSLGVIDFQDAVIGAYTYDLVSLVRDAYIDFPEDWVQKWIGDFWQKLKDNDMPAAQTATEFETQVNIMGVQRHLKVLGIFVRLSQRDGKDRYLADMPKVMRDLVIELDYLQNADLTSLANGQLKTAMVEFSEWLHSEALPIFEQKFKPLK
ncbi:aminoglycoside phosphotransferase family protein [Psychrobacter ciconiae]|uniref:aminoglycoside phosphotransferase family protein n=1 Tax=Psychrobacter ciconiae TaxID=1553449 RepID=UPI0019184EBB|nr:phosphotransferase [Psychrobacter ciconiae]